MSKTLRWRKCTNKKCGSVSYVYQAKCPLCGKPYDAKKEGKK